MVKFRNRAGSWVGDFAVCSILCCLLSSLLPDFFLISISLFKFGLRYVAFTTTFAFFIASISQGGTATLAQYMDLYDLCLLTLGCSGFAYIISLIYYCLEQILTVQK